MAQFNPDLLLKDELSYEALLRGLPYTNVTVAELRKTLRENRPDKPSLLNRLSVLDFESEKKTCYHKYTEFTSIAQTMRNLCLKQASKKQSNRKINLRNPHNTFFKDIHIFFRTLSPF